MKSCQDNRTIIGIDASRSVDFINKTGVEKVSDELIKEIEKLSNKEIKGNKISIFYYTSRLVNWLLQDKQKVIKLKKLWTVLGLSFEMIHSKPDILFVPVHTLPFFCPKKTYKIIHDIAFKKESESYSFWQRLYLNLDLKRCVKKCKKIFVATQEIKNDLLKYTEVDKNRVVVVPFGYNIKAPAQIATQNVTGRQKQILYIGRLEEKKNISNLIKAFEIFNKKYPEYKLILAGKAGYGFKSVKCQMSNVKCLGYITDEKKYELLSESACLVLISKQEGFGFPILEGFDFKLPVLASDIPVLHEVGADACLYTNPVSAQDIALGLEKITQNDELRKDLVAKGSQRLKLFNWQIAAEKYLQEMIE